MRLRPSLLLIGLTSLTILLAGCGSSSSNVPPANPITVVLSSPPSSVGAGATAALTANVSNDSANAGVTWSATCSASSCGSFSPASTPSGSATTYTAPAVAGSVTLTATSVTDTTKTASAMVSITAGAGITVALSPPPPATLAPSATGSLTAVVTGDSANAGVTWSATCSGSVCGSFNPTSTASGTATAYTAPASVPTSGTVTVVATSVTDKTKSASATISITLTPPPAGILKDGNYVFHASGEDFYTSGGQQYPGPYYVAGVFTVANGVISGGEQDFLDYSSTVTNNISASGSSIVQGTTGNIQVLLNTGNSSIGVNGIETLNGTMVSSSRVLINEFDSFASGAGSIDLQTSVAAPSGGYAFVFNGTDNTSNGYALGIGGVLNISGTSLNTGGSVFDCNDGGTTIAQAQQFTGGSVSAPDSFGRVTVTLTPNSACQLSQMVFAGYVNSSQIQLVEAPSNSSDQYNGTLGGVALSQGQNTGQFSAASVTGKTYVFTSTGADANGEFTLGGGLAFGSGSSLSGQLALNDLTMWGASNIASGSYTVDPTGRATLTNVVTSGNQTSPVLTLDLQVYLDGNGNALELGVDGVEVTTGQSYLQTSNSFPTSGNYGMLSNGFVPIDQNGDIAYWTAVGPITMSSSGFTGTADYNPQGGTLQPGLNLNATVNSTDGMLTLGGLDPNYGTDEFNYYSIDGSRVLAIETDGNELGLLQIEPVSSQ